MRRRTSIFGIFMILGLSLATTAQSGYGPGHNRLPSSAYALHDAAGEFAYRVERRGHHYELARMAQDFERATRRFQRKTERGVWIGDLMHEFRGLERCFADLRHAANYAGIGRYGRHGYRDPLYPVAEALSDLRRALFREQRRVSQFRHGRDAHQPFYRDRPPRNERYASRTVRELYTRNR